MPAKASTCRVAIAGAASLRGAELKQLLEETAFPSAEIRLLDEDLVAGTLTEAGGEPALIQSVDEDSFAHMHFVFFAGRADFAAHHWRSAHRAGATVIDLSGALAEAPEVEPWIPALDGVLPRLAKDRNGVAGTLFYAPAAPALVACSLAAALGQCSVERLALVFFQPVSERGQAGIEELESQTVKLLSLQPIAREVFDAQVAFNLLDRYGPASAEPLSATRQSVTRDVRRYLAGRAPHPAIQLIQVPAFHGLTFTAFAEFAAGFDPVAESRALERALESVGIKLAEDPPPSNVAIAGESQILLARVEQDALLPRGFWFWGAADNLRLPAVNAVRIAERLLVS